VVVKTCPLSLWERIRVRAIIVFRLSLFPEPWPPFCVSDGHDYNAILNDPVNYAKRKPPYWAFSMHIIYLCKSLWIGGNYGQCCVNGIHKAYRGLFAPFSIPIKRLIKVVTGPGKKVNW
jgi:hypothetical protein